MVKKDNSYDPVCEVLYRLNVGSKMDIELLELAFDRILLNSSSRKNDVQLSAILTGIMARGPKKEEIIALLKSVFKLDNFNPKERKKIKLPKGKILVGAIGSGKKGTKTMNISTPALLTAASLGAYTAKAVSHSTSSLTGSTDFLEGVGAKLNIPFDKMEKIILKTGFGAFKIEGLLPNFDSIYGQKFIAPHALSFGLAALASPIKYDTFLDGIGVYGKTKLIGVINGRVGKLKIWNPIKELNLPEYTPKHIGEGRDIRENIKLSLDVLKGKGDVAREDIIAINAGTILHLTRITHGLKEGYEKSKKAIKEGLPYRKLMEFIKETGGDLNKLKEFE